MQVAIILTHRNLSTSITATAARLCVQAVGSPSRCMQILEFHQGKRATRSTKKACTTTSNRLRAICIASERIQMLPFTCATFCSRKLGIKAPLFKTENHQLQLQPKLQHYPTGRFCEGFWRSQQQQAELSPFWFPSPTLWNTCSTLVNYYSKLLWDCYTTSNSQESARRRSTMHACHKQSTTVRWHTVANPPVNKTHES